MSSSLRPLIEELLRTIQEHRLKEFASAAQGIAKMALEGGLAPAELTAGIGELARGLTSDAMGPFGLIAGAAAALVEQGGSPMPMREALPERAFGSMTPAVIFPDLWKAASAGRPLPAPGDRAMLRELLNGTMSDVLERVGAEFIERSGNHDGIPAADAGLVLAYQWFDVTGWVQCLRTAMLDREFRMSFPAAERDRMRETARALKRHLTDDCFLQAAYLEQVAMVLDDEPLVVIDAASQRGIRLTIGGIRDNEQLYTLLAAVLSDHGFPGIQPPLPSWLDESAAEPGERVYVYRRMRLFDGQGRHVSPLDWPAEIGVLNGARVVVVHPADECKWRKRRPFPLMVPSMVFDYELSRTEIAAWLGQIMPAREDDHSLFREKYNLIWGNRHGHAQPNRLFR